MKRASRRWMGPVAAALLLLGPACKPEPQKKDIFRAALDGDLPRIEALVSANAELVNAQNPSGMTPLHLAAWEGRAAVTEFLLQHGADPNVAEANGDTPLHFAASSGYAEIARSLLKHGAQVNARNKDGKTPLSRGRPRSEIAELLKKHGGVE
jgi:ankyrin repeat protein